MVIIGQTGKREAYERYSEAVFDSASAVQKNYIIKPGAAAFCITSEDHHSIENMQYGLVPFWVETEIHYAEAPIEGLRHRQTEGPVKKRLIHEPAFRKPIRCSRTIIPVDYFILHENQRACLFFHHEFSLLTLAGIYDYPPMLTDTENAVPGFALITWPAYGIFKSAGFTRVPLILPVNRHKKWIRNGISLFEVTQMMAPYDETLINGCALDADLVSVGKNSRESIAPVGKRIKPAGDMEQSRAVRSSLCEYRRQRHETQKNTANQNSTLWRGAGQ